MRGVLCFSGTKRVFQSRLLVSWYLWCPHNRICVIANLLEIGSQCSQCSHVNQLSTINPAVNGTSQDPKMEVLYYILDYFGISWGYESYILA